MKEDSNKKIIVRGVLLVFSIFLLALSYNLLLLPNDLVIGGVSGLAIIFTRITGFNDAIFIYSCNAILITLSYFLLGKEKTKNTIVGAILYPIMITFTVPIAHVLIPYFNFDDFWLTTLLAALTFGLGSGMVFRYGYSTGGSDIMISIVTKFFKLPEGSSMLFLNLIIVSAGGLIFGLEMMIYAIIVLYISSLVLNKVMFDISNSKTFYIVSEDEENIKKMILEEFKTGFTIMPTKGGYKNKGGSMIMTVLSNREYYHFKNRVLEIDSKAFFVISDCYEAQGGYKRKNIPYV